MPNRLSAAASPYLLQHADNPVDWLPWGNEAFEEARRRDAPVLLSVGYAACHWCHVMAHESFEDPATAELMNAGFVNIKVDREERPDVDSIYMQATTALTGSGGWPMTVFLDHRGRPFYAGTYFPPSPRHGMPAFTQVLQAVRSAWDERREQVLEGAERIDSALSQTMAASRRAADGEGAAEPPRVEDLDAAVHALSAAFDPRAGGFGGAPKFPPSAVLVFLLRNYRRTGDPRALAMVEGTCEAMARGGIYDQLDGGFARYSVDAAWAIPHFEKMLYDNALLLGVYLDWWRVGEHPLARRVAWETADFLLREMRSDEGGFISALDADSLSASSGQIREGAAYTWTREELGDVLGEDAAWAEDLLGISTLTAMEDGRHTLRLPVDPEDRERWSWVRSLLLDSRRTRPAPLRDDKLVAAWNGLAIHALAEASILLDEPRFLASAVEAAEVLWEVHRIQGEEGSVRLARTSRHGRATLTAPGALEDYADVAAGFLMLSSVTGESRWLERAAALLDVALRHFTEGGVFFDAADDVGDLARRPQDPTDNAVPSGRTAVAGALLSYAALTGSQAHREAARRALEVVGPLAAADPRFIGWGLAVAEAMIDGPREVAIIGRPGSPELLDLRRTAFRHASPGQVTAWGSADSRFPLLRGKALVHGAAAAYVCRDLTCRAPVTSEEELRVALSSPAQRMP